MANIKAKDINQLQDWNSKELRKLRMTINNRISALQNSVVKDLSTTHPLHNMEVGQCKELLEKVMRAEKNAK
jgi:hypothetical protein